MKKIYWLYIAIGAVIILAVRWWMKNKGATQVTFNPNPTQVAITNTGKPVVTQTNPGGNGTVPNVVTLKSDPKTFVLQDQVYAGETLILYPSESISSTATELVAKDQYIGRFISVRPSGWAQVSSIKTGKVMYIPSTKIIYVK